MNRRLSVVIGVLGLMAIFASTVLAAPTQAGKSAALVGVDYQQSGIVLIFKTSGLAKNDLKDNSFSAHSNSYDMYCIFIDDTNDVRCTVSKKFSQYAGEGFHATLAGFGFWGEIPEKKTETKLTCPDGQALWYVVQIYFGGEWYITSIPAEDFDTLIAWLEEHDSSALVLITKEFCYAII